ncbi:hypothetical protein KFU94_69495 [Chloroflexi bacterium TSY]|nr:hypothetical protein [Chloroflexi bacterium TSY]
MIRSVFAGWAWWTVTLGPESLARWLCGGVGGAVLRYCALVGQICMLNPLTKGVAL